MSRSRSYKQSLFKALQDPQEAKEYLNAALEDPSPQVFILALRHVAEANKEGLQVEMKIDAQEFD
jgi:DNA-binding phage protein